MAISKKSEEVTLRNRLRRGKLLVASVGLVCLTSGGVLAAAGGSASASTTPTITVSSVRNVCNTAGIPAHVVTTGQVVGHDYIVSAALQDSNYPDAFQKDYTATSTGIDEDLVFENPIGPEAIPPAAGDAVNFVLTDSTTSTNVATVTGTLPPCTNPTPPTCTQAKSANDFTYAYDSKGGLVVTPKKDTCANLVWQLYQVPNTWDGKGFDKSASNQTRVDSDTKTSSGTSAVSFSVSLDKLVPSLYKGECFAVGQLDLQNAPGQTTVDWPAGSSAPLYYYVGPFKINHPMSDCGSTPPPLTPVTATAPTANDACGTANDTYTIPSTEGVEYKVGGTVATAGSHPGSGTVTITADALSGYTLTGTASWAFTFTNASCGTYTPPPVVYTFSPSAVLHAFCNGEVTGRVQNNGNGAGSVDLTVGGSGGPIALNPGDVQELNLPGLAPGTVVIASYYDSSGTKVVLAEATVPAACATPTSTTPTPAPTKQSTPPTVGPKVVTDYVGSASSGSNVQRDGGIALLVTGFMLLLAIALPKFKLTTRRH